MDWEKYAKELEIIIDAIELKDYQRTLVNALVREAKQKSVLNNGKA